MKIKRNEPCPCGSGKKYKKCCLIKDEEQASIRRKEVDQNLLALEEEVRQLDDLSNSVLDLIEMGKFEEAEEVCQKLEDEYPDQVDAFERRASLYEAKGDFEKAISNHQKTVEFMSSHEDFDEELIQWHRNQIQILNAEIQGEL